MILRIIRFINNILTAVAAIILAVAGMYACYALWDNHQIYQAAENVQADMLRLKPEAADGEEGPSFEEIAKINSDVCAWITMDGTRIDYPVLLGETNLTYINTDVYGNFSLAGSIFMDSRCDRNFEDAYTLLYGHHMENGSMFGDLDLYKEQQFFQENRIGVLLLPSRVVPLRTLACLLAEASEDEVFETEQWTEDISGFVEYVREHAMFCDEEMAAAIERRISNEAEGSGRTGEQILVLSTCSSEFTNARTILICVMNGKEE